MTEEKRGGVLFFGKARCSTCHFGPLLGGQSFANIGAPQIGPGVGKAAPLDMGLYGAFVVERSSGFLIRAPLVRAKLAGVREPDDAGKAGEARPADQNVDLAAEFTNLIVAQRGFQANSRVITASDELLQDLVNLKR